MKRNISILAICIIIASYIFAIPRFNEESINRALFYEYRDGILPQQHIMTIEVQNNLDPATFLAFIDEKFIEHHLTAYIVRSNVTQDGVPNQDILYHSSNDDRICKKILLNKGKMDPTLSGKYYSTFAEDPNYRIANILIGENVSVKNIRDGKEAGGFYYIGCLSGDMTQNIENFIKDVKDEYENTVIYYQPYEIELGIEPILAGKRHRVMISLLLVILLCSSLFTKIREIAINRLEGRSSIELYIKYFEKDFIKYTLIGALLMMAINFFIFNQSMDSLKVLSLITFQEYAMFIAGVQFFSLGLIIVIQCMPISVSIKGKNNLNALQVLAYTMKLCVCIIWIPTVSSSLLNTIDTIQLMWHYEDGVKQFANMYRINGSSTIDFLNRADTSEAYALEQDMFNEFNAFEFSGGYIGNDATQELYPVMFVDDRYIQLNGILPESFEYEDNTIYIFLNEKNDLYPGYLEKMENAILSANDSLKIKWQTYEGRIPTYHVQSLAYEKYVKPNDVLVLNNTGSNTNINGHFIISEEDVNQTQEKIIKIFNDNTFECNLSLESMESYYAASIKYRINYQLEILKSFFILLGCYLLTNILLMDIDIANNKSRYFATMIEGRFTYSFTVYLMKMASPTIIAFVIYMIKRGFVFDHNTVNTIMVLLIIEALIFMIYSFHYKRKMREMK